MPAGRGQPHCVLLSDTVIETDPRVRKFARTLYDAEWCVVTIGLPPAENVRNAAPPWQQIHIAQTGTDEDVKFNQPFIARIFSLVAEAVLPISKKASRLLRKAAQRAGRGDSLLQRACHYWDLRFGLRLSYRPYEKVFFNTDPKYAQFIIAATEQIAPPDLWIANDWNMLPIALALAEKMGGKVLYDSHEYAVEQFITDKNWRRYRQPLVRAVERNCIKRVDAVSSVSPGLCLALQARYGLEKTPICIRNMPPYQAFGHKICGEKITVLYQGVIGPGRALEALIHSTPLWHRDYRLIIRGPEGKAGYIHSLHSIIGMIKPEVEIEIAPPVPFDEMITKAHEADIGILALPGRTIHNRFALPNKVFEYMTAGLALCISNHKDMADLIRAHKNGAFIEGLSPKEIADAIHTLDRKTVDNYKQASLDAAKALCWENEGRKAVNLCKGMVE